MTLENPVVSQYLARFDAALARLDVPDRQGISRELRDHFADAIGAGKSLDVMLRALGPADTLARAYGVELLLHAEARRRDRVRTGLRAFGIMASASLVTFIVAGVLGLVGIGFNGTGLGIVAIGGFEAAGVHLPGVETRGLPATVVMLFGLIVGIVGVASLLGLRAYVRAIVRVLRSTLPRRTDPAGAAIS
jgi:uncharacterized membrane protein